MPCVDLTGTIENGMWDFGPPLAPVCLETVGDLEKQGWVSHNIRMSALSGTYLETAGHVIRGAPSLDAYPVETFMLKAVVIRVPREPGGVVRAGDLESGLRAKADAQALILDANWHRHWGKPDFVTQSPFLDKDAARLIADHHFTIVGADLVGFDPPGAPHMDHLEAIFRSGALVLSPLVNLDRLPARTVTLMAFPLKFKGLNASPCRAIACW